jgi:hypothetical protein
MSYGQKMGFALISNPRVTSVRKHTVAPRNHFHYNSLTVPQLTAGTGLALTQQPGDGAGPPSGGANRSIERDVQTSALDRDSGVATLWRSFS